MEKLHICFISDTHGKHREAQIEPVDLLIHCGDFSTSIVLEKGSRDFLMWFAGLSAECKIIVAGNHDKVCVKYNKEFRQVCAELGIVYLENSGYAYRGIKIWGVPNARYHLIGAAFDIKSDADIDGILDRIPADTDVLLSHAPPDCFMGHEENYRRMENPMMRKIQELDLKIHGFGHVHKQNGISRIGNTTLINSCVVNNCEEYIGSPVIIDYDSNWS